MVKISEVSGNKHASIAGITAFVTLVALGMVLLLFGASTGSKQNIISELTTKNQQLEQQNSKLQGEIAELQQEVSDLKTMLNKPRWLLRAAWYLETVSRDTADMYYDQMDEIRARWNVGSLIVRNYTVPNIGVRNLMESYRAYDNFSIVRAYCGAPDHKPWSDELAEIGVELAAEWDEIWLNTRYPNSDPREKHQEIIDALGAKYGVKWHVMALSDEGPSMLISKYVPGPWIDIYQEEMSPHEHLDYVMSLFGEPWPECTEIAFAVYTNFETGGSVLIKVWR